MKIKRRLAFSLIELMVVVMIIGILAMIGIPKFIRSVEESRASEAMTNIGAYVASQERYFTQFGSYASDPKALDMGFFEFSYFTISEFGKKITLTRNTNAGGDLGQWRISVTMPNNPTLGGATYLWECAPMPACKYLLPHNNVGGVVSAN